MLALILAAALSPASDVSAPELDGHVFMPSQLVDSPFRSTTFKLGILYGFGSATGTKYDLSGNATGTADYTFAAFAQTFRYEYRFAEWISAGTVVVTSLYSGIDGPSMVSIGANVGLAISARVKAGHRFGPIETAIVVDAGTTPEFGFLVGAAVIKAIKDNVLDPWAGFQQTHGVAFNPALAVAFAPTTALGLTANLGYLYESLKVNGTSVGEQSAVQLAAAADFDFGKIGAPPVGINLAYRLNSPIGEGKLGSVQDISAGIFYTARRELGLGMEAGYRIFKLAPQNFDASAGVVQLQLQYYW